MAKPKQWVAVQWSLMSWFWASRTASHRRTLWRPMWSILVKVCIVKGGRGGEDLKPDYCIAGGATPPCAPASPRPWWWCQCSIIVSSFIFKWSLQIPLRSHLMATLLLNWQIELELGWKFFFRIQPDQVFSHNMCSLSILIIRNSSKSGSTTCRKSRLFLSGSWHESAPVVRFVWCTIFNSKTANAQRQEWKTDTNTDSTR